MLYGFELDSESGLSMSEVMRRVEAGDISPSELIIGGAIAENAKVKKLKEKGAFVSGGVKAAAEEVKARIKKSLKLE